MVVYHGSYCIVSKPNIAFSREALDFGKGFYVTDIKEQAINWTNRFKLKGQQGIVNIYELNISEVNKNFNVKIFEHYDNEWLDFILDCRSGSEIFKKFDVLIGGIADDRVYNTMELYEDKLISKEEALKRLKFYKPNNQICIVNQDVIDKYLKFNESQEV